MNQPADAASAAWVQESAFLMIRLNFNYFQSGAPDACPHLPPGCPPLPVHQLKARRAAPAPATKAHCTADSDPIAARTRGCRYGGLAPIDDNPSFHLQLLTCLRMRALLHAVCARACRVMLHSSARIERSAHGSADNAGERSPQGDVRADAVECLEASVAKP